MPCQGLPPGGVRSPLPSGMLLAAVSPAPASAESALLLRREPAMHGGSRWALKAASLLGMGRAPAWAGSKEPPAASDFG